MLQISKIQSGGWLLFFYSLPSKPVSNRMKIWRKLSQIGAVPFKGSVYVLPDNEEHHEYFQWLVSEVVTRGGEGAFVRVERIESMEEKELKALFDQNRNKEYHPVETGVDALERRLGNYKKGGTTEPKKSLIEDFNRLLKEFERVRKVDFFSSIKGAALEIRLKAIDNAITSLSAKGIESPEKLMNKKNRKDYQRKTWATRKRPYVDRIASAWLIMRFIDPKALFKFIKEDEATNPEEGLVTFDMKNGEFTHQGDLCTFEVMIRVFGLKDKALKKMAQIVHQIDLKDEKYPAPEARGIEELLNGIRKTVKEDPKILEKGMALFEMLYASKIS